MERMVKSVAMDARPKNAQAAHHQTLSVVAMAALGSGLASMDCVARVETTPIK